MRWGVAAAAIVLGVVIGSVAWLMIGNPEQRERAERDQYLRERAWMLCTEAMRDQAIAPSSALFPDFPGPRATVERMGGGRYEVRGWMDAENRLGGRAGSDFACVAIPGTNSATVVTINRRGE